MSASGQPAVVGAMPPGVLAVMNQIPRSGNAPRRCGAAMSSARRNRAVRRLLARPSMRAYSLVLAALLASACGGSSGPTSRPGSPSSGVGSDAGQPVDAGPADAGSDAGIGYANRPSPILAENRLPGRSGWRLDNPSGQIAAYADRTSALPG